MEIPESLRQITEAREGSAGTAWLASLPRLADELLQRWDCVPAGPPVSGKVGIVVPATSAAHGDVVLKVSFPHPANVHEPTAYETWQGRGAVELRERDNASFAMLLERAGPDRPIDAIPVDDAFAIAGTLARELAVPAPPHLPRLSDRANGWTETLRLAATRMPSHVVGAATETVRDLCRTQPETMVHGDLHFNNVLRGVREPWQVIDPRGWVGDPAYDAITLLRTTAIHLLDPDDFAWAIPRWVTIFAAAAELDREHVRRWAQVRAVIRAHQSWERNQPQRMCEANDRVADILT